jgi:uncharacterized protein (TIGR03067 family)
MAFPQIVNIVLVAAASILVLYWVVSRGKKLEARQKIDRDVAKSKDSVQAIEGDPVTFDALQGEWRVLEMGKRGRFAPIEELALADLRMRVSGDRLTMLRSGETDKLKLNAATFPTELDQLGTDGKTTLCIARMLDGQLELCQADPGDGRPSNFSRDRSNKNTVVRFVRVAESQSASG